MITVGKINDDIARATESAHDFMVAGKKSMLSKTKKRIEFLRLCKSYLESNPSEEFLKKDEERILNRMKLIHEGFDAWLKNGEEKPKVKKREDLKTIYEKKMDMPSLREKLATLKYILYGT